MAVPLLRVALVVGLCCYAGSCAAESTPAAVGRKATASERLERLETVVLEQQDQLVRQGVLIRQLQAEQQRLRAEQETERQYREIQNAERETERKQYQALRAECEALRQMVSENGQGGYIHKERPVPSTVVKDKVHSANRVSMTNGTKVFANSKKSRNGNQSVSTDVSPLLTHAPGSLLIRRHDDREVSRVSVRADDTNPLEPVLSQLSQKVSEMEAELQTVKAASVQQDQDIQDAARSLYIRWGSATCPHAEQLVYQGVAGGSLHTDTGAAANFLCLSLSPVAGPAKPSAAHATLYGAEYETHDAHYEKDPVCAVCRSPRPTVLMVPGTNRCLPGWTTEYTGFLMAGHHGQAAATEFICVDSQMESRLGGDTNQNGHLLYFTEAVCGSLPCQPYVNSEIITCAVCSM